MQKKIPISPDSSSLDVPTALDIDYKTLVQAANCVIIHWTTNGTLIFMNEYGLQFFGYTADEVVGQNIFEMIVPDNESSGRDIHALRAEIVAHPDLYAYNENENVRKDGSRVWMAWRNSVIYDSNGAPTGVVASGVDISARRRAEEETQLIKDRYQSLFDHMTESFSLQELICDEEGRPVDYRFLDINPPFEQQIGFKKEDILGKSMLEVFPTTDPSWIEIYGKVAMTGVPAHFERHSEIIGKHYEVIAFSPKHGQFASLFTDITARKQVEEALQHRLEAEQLINALSRKFVGGTEAIDILVLEALAAIGDFARVDREAIYIENDDDTTFTCVYEWHNEETPPLPLLFHTLRKDQIPRIYDHLSRLEPIYLPRVEEILSESAEEEIVTSLGTQSVVIVPLVDEARFTGWISLVNYQQPITWTDADIDLFQTIAAIFSRAFSHHRLDDELVDSERRYRLLVETIDAGFMLCKVILDADDNPVDYVFEDVNAGYEQIVALRREDVIGKRVTEVFPHYQEDPFNWIDKLGQVAITGNPFQFDQHSEVTDHFVSGHAYCPAPGFFAVLFFNITDRKQNEEILREKTQELEAKTLQLERSNQDLEAFAYAASHDMKEPLRTVSGFLQLLARRYKDQLDAKASDYIQRAIGGANRMDQLVSDLLIYSRVQSQAATFDVVDLNGTIQEVLSNMEASIISTGAEITFESLPLVWGDRAQLAQLLQNLLSNAVKFHKEGEIPRVHIGVTESENGNLHACELYVRDNGIGIDPANFGKLFNAFRRLHTREEYPGTGIGLAICKKIVERHGGRIWVNSTLDNGASFHFTLAMPKSEIEIA